MLNNFLIPGEMKSFLTPNNNKFKPQSKTEQYFSKYHTQLTLIIKLGQFLWGQTKFIFLVKLNPAPFSAEAEVSFIPILTGDPTTHPPNHPPAGQVKFYLSNFLNWEVRFVGISMTDAKCPSTICQSNISPNNICPDCNGHP